MPEGDSFLPRIQSVFYAIFDTRQGPKIVYQVPEGLIAVPSAGPSSASNDNSSVPATPLTEASFPLPTTTRPGNGLGSRTSSASLISPTEHRPGARKLSSPQKRSSSSQRTLFNFNDISIHRIIGFPVELNGANYERNYFRYNLCFVFDREADLSCYEPIVRKVSRVLKNCEEESAFLSSNQTSPAVHAILEQLYEDLNSYSETSIAIDQFNSIELKIFPFYPNPPQVKDWMVPLALINLTKRIEENWDLTMCKVCKFIDGVNHVSRIAHLADCDISLTRQAISHLLYYQVIMTIDIFQYSNMYTLRKSVQWLADESHVKDECGPYVTKPGRSIPDWPKLLHLYSRLKPGNTIYEWMKTYDVENLGIDVRRFTSFGVVKGFLRRVHRYPIYLPPDLSEPMSSQLTYPAAESAFDPISNSTLARKRGKSLSGTNIRFPTYNSVSSDLPPPGSNRLQTQASIVAPTTALPENTLFGNLDTPLASATPVSMSATHRARRASAAEKVLEQLRNRDIQKAGASPRTSWMNMSFQHEPAAPPSTANLMTAMTAPSAMTSVASASTTAVSPSHTATLVQESPTKLAAPGGRSESRRQSLITPAVPPPSPVTAKVALTPSRAARPSRSPSMTIMPQLPQGQGQSTQYYVPPEFIQLLDGEHHTDELSVRFEAGWPLIEQWLRATGGGEGDGDYGRVVVIYK